MPNELPYIDWICPECGAANSDSPTFTAVPYCGECEQDISWSYIEEFTKEEDSA